MRSTLKPLTDVGQSRHLAATADMSSFLEQLERLQPRTTVNDFTITTILSYAIALLFLLHQILYHFDIASLSLQDALWNTLVYLIPMTLLLDAQQKKELGVHPHKAQVHAAKSEAIRRVLGMSGHTLMQQLPGAAGVARRFSMARGGPATIKSNAPSGLGNWDNSCYQNSVLQGLTSLTSLEQFLDRWSNKATGVTTLDTLRETTAKLRDPSNNGRHIWTPAKLKSMSSWQQQDAQEYFSKIMDELDKDVSKIQKATSVLDGLETAGRDRSVPAEEAAGATIHNPLEGLLSQRVACTACGFSEGLSMIPFNCLTLPLGQSHSYDIEDCLDEYTKVEPITDVECAKCTLLKTRRDLHKMTDTTDDAVKKITQLPPELRAQIMQRIQEVERALDGDDFSDETLKQKCQISKNNRVSSTKTRQALIGRAPRSLIVHINRSVFSELTGMQSKNYARVQYPAVLDLGPWVLGSRSETDSDGDLPRDDTSSKHIYRLRAIVTHYGRHENGHYIAYRQSPGEGEDEKQWWRLSDEDVSPSSNEDVLDQGGVFMLFYERTYDLEQPKAIPEADAIPDALPNAMTDAVPDTMSLVESDDKMLIDSVLMNELGDAATERFPTDELILPMAKQDDTFEVDVSEASTTEDEAEQEPLPPVRVASPASPFMMRTANHDVNNDHWNPGRFIAAT